MSSDHAVCRRRRAPARRKHIAHLHLERLEGRDEPAKVDWTLGANGDFAIAANWTEQGTGLHRVPGPADDAAISSQFAVTSSAAQTVNSLIATGFTVTGGSFSISAQNTVSVLVQLTVASGGALVVTGGNQPVNVIDCEVSGALTVGGGGALRFLRGINNHLNAGVSLSGAGQFLIEGDSQGAPTVTLNAPVTAPANMVLRHGVLSGPSTLTIPAGVTFNWVTGGAGSASMVGPGITTVEAGGTLVIGGTNGAALIDRTISNAGTVIVKDTGVLNFNGLARLDNLVNGTLSVQNDIAIAGNTSGVNVPLINNAGAVIKSSPTGTGTTTLNVRIDNGGTITVQSGTLMLTRDGTHTGQFNVLGATLVFIGGMHALNAGASFPGPGPVSLAGGELQVNAAVSAPNFIESAGLVRGTGTLTVSGSATWSGGGMADAGTTAVAPGATLTLAGVAVKTLDTARVLTNAGTINHSGTGPLLLNNGAVVNNQVTGVYNLTGDTDFGFASGTINNAGLFVRSSSTGTGISTISQTFNNSGTVRVDSGTVQLSAGGTDTGQFNVASVGTLAFAGGTHVLNAGVSFPGPGPVSLAGGELQVNAAVSTPNFTESAGMVRGAGTLTLTGTATWTGGGMTDSGATAVSPGATLTLAGPAEKALDASRKLNVSGTVIHSGTGPLKFNSGVILSVLPTGFYNLSENADFSSPSGTVNNAGLFVKSSPNGAGTSNVNQAFNNSGTLRIESGTLTIASLAQMAGAITVAAAATLQAPAVPVSGGTLSGAGIVAGAVANNSAVSPGGTSPGTLTVNGNYTQPTGSLNIELNGTLAGSGYDQLKVNGTVSLGGPLSLSAAVTPPSGTVFVLIDNDGNDPVAGTFANLPQGAQVTANGTSFTISYAGGTGNDVILSVTVPAAPRVTGTQVNDGSAQRSRVTSLTVTFSTQVTFAGPVANAFTLTRDTDGAAVTFAGSAVTVSGATVVTLFNFSGAAVQSGSLSDGRYTLTAVAAQITGNGRQLDGNGDGIAGDNYTFGSAQGLFRLYGDVNGDRFVNGTDFGGFRTAFASGAGDPNYIAALDVNGDGFVNGTDFAEFRVRFGGGI